MTVCSPIIKHHWRSQWNSIRPSIAPATTAQDLSFEMLQDSWHATNNYQPSSNPSQIWREHVEICHISRTLVFLAKWLCRLRMVLSVGQLWNGSKLWSMMSTCSMYGILTIIDPLTDPNVGNKSTLKPILGNAGSGFSNCELGHCQTSEPPSPGDICSKVEEQLWVWSLILHHRHSRHSNSTCLRP